MFSSTTLRPIFVLVVALLLSVGNTVAGTPFTRAIKRGYGYTHRPYYKQYKSGVRGLFARR
ncbi:hypothetical protein H8B15_07160 [Hymenobacter sp. BT507]|uniref:Uncharacterized protein n=1 Tax=Hymenobacter citatus TaxID=2763506 RepID=A0ABR7MI02_9BACT|nr:hypothetical protein [Hymenobacter citatus]MBC6610695.1 hypothetical protein [Hymenobacter citatus]